nr:hypothetical protein [Pandoravirus massiliensis]
MATARQKKRDENIEQPQRQSDLEHMGQRRDNPWRAPTQNPSVAKKEKQQQNAQTNTAAGFWFFLYVQKKNEKSRWQKMPSGEEGTKKRENRIRSGRVCTRGTSICRGR